jgi:phosphohistidine phosphatase SixA
MACGLLYRAGIITASTLLVIMSLTLHCRAAGDTPLEPVSASHPKGAYLIERLRDGGLVMFFRHADTIGMPCDASFKIGDRKGQRNISERGQDQARSIGAAFNEYSIPFSTPVLAGPVYRARDTAEHAFGKKNVRVTNSLLADDFSGSRLEWVLAEHRRLFSERVLAGTNRVLVGHRTPAIMVLGQSVAQQAFPEGAALVIEPTGQSAKLLGILMLAPIKGAGFSGC